MKKISFIYLLLFCVIFGGCRSVPSQKSKMELSLKDSLFWSKKSVDSLLKIPYSYATLIIQPERIQSGDIQEKKEGQAKVQVKKREDGNIEVTASCDSLQLRIYILEESLTSIKKENQSLQEEIKAAPNKWEWFSKGALSILIVGLIVWIYKKFR